MKKLFLILLVSVLSGCSLFGPEPEDPIIQRSGMKVSVYTGGKKLENPERELVHRVDVPEAELSKCQELFSSAAEWMKTENDSTGKGTGVRVVAARANTFGLKRGDLLLSINRTHVNDVSDVSIFCPSFRKAKTVSMSVVRNAETHEIYLNVIN